MKKLTILLLLTSILSFNVFGAITDGLVEYYSFDADCETGDFLGKDGTPVNNPTNTGTGCHYNNCCDFNQADNEYVNINVIGGSWTDTQGTLTAWSQADTVTDEAIIWFGKNPAGNSEFCRLRHESDTSFQCYDQGAGSGNIVTDSSNTSLRFLAMTWNSDYHVTSSYINDESIGSATANSLTFATADEFRIGAGGWNGALASYFDGKIDEVAIWNRTLDATELGCIYENNYPWVACDGAVNDTTPPTITNINQNPANLTVTNALLEGLIINATITDNVQVNTSTVQLNLNGSGIHTCLNGVCRNITNIWFDYNHSVGNVYTWVLDENEYISGTENINHSEFYVQERFNNTLSTANQWLKIRFYNVTNDHDLIFTEIMDTNSTGIAEYYYCNEDYTTGNPVGSSDCTKFFTQTGDDTLHAHRGNSWHRIMPMAINSTGFLNDVLVTQLSYILKRGSSTGETYFYINNDTDSAETTNNNGNAWTSQTYTVDSHLHFIDESDSINYSICAEDNSSNRACSEIFNDTIDFPLLPPTPVSILSPVAEGEYNVSVNITHTESQTLTGGSITTYLMEYQRGNISGWTEIIDNNYPDLSYLWSVENLNNDNYRIRITVTDSNNLTAITISEYFRIENELGLDTQLLQSILDELQSQSNIFDRIEGGIMLIGIMALFIALFISAFYFRMYWLLSLDGAISFLISLLSWNYISSTDFFQRAMVWIFLFLGFGLFLMGISLQILYSMELNKKKSMYDYY